MSKMKTAQLVFQVLCLRSDYVIYYRSSGKNGGKRNRMNSACIYCENGTRLVSVEIYGWINIQIIEKSFDIVMLSPLYLRIIHWTHRWSVSSHVHAGWPFPAGADLPSSRHLNQAEPIRFFLPGVWSFDLLSNVWVWFGTKAGLWPF